MKSSQILILAICCFAAAVQGDEALGVDCGGSIGADTNTLRYPAPGQSLVRGETCVWTINLETTSTFILTVPHIRVHSNFSDCRDSGIRIYGLSNQVPANQMQSYTFCDGRPGDQSVFLNGNVAVITLYISPETPIDNPLSGFNLTWSGAQPDTQQTQHLSSYSNAPTGIIGYPGVGSYSPNIASTWFVDTTQSPDLILDTVRLEGCALNDRCLCDALILYEAVEDGKIIETRRWCGNANNTRLTNRSKRMILAFFSDSEIVGGGATGFLARYGPPDPITTTPTTTTTEGTNPHLCGQTFWGSAEGTIRYKAGQIYSPNERCVFTIRIPNAVGMKFEILQGGIAPNDANDGISISTFTRADPPLLSSAFIKNEGDPVTLNGSIAIVTFESNEANQGLGFILRYEAVGFYAGNISLPSADFISKSSPGSLEHPGEGLNYTNNELSTFIITPPEFSLNDSPKTNVTWTLKKLEGSCYDYVVVYKFYPGPVNTGGGWSQYDLYCASSKSTSHTDLLLYVFMTDRSDVNVGWSLDWNLI